MLEQLLASTPGVFDMQPLRFREDKTTQAAARLLRARGGRMPYMSLLKLLDFADRRALAELGRPISYDLFVSMPHGPVLSRTLDLITAEPDRGAPSYWRQYISEPENYEVRLLREAPNDQLSTAEESILDDVFREFGHPSRWQLVERSHELPEWRDTQGSSVPIDLRTILMEQGVTRDDADAIVADLLAEAAVDPLRA
jgi:uncharacterized phage-associated protein